MAKQNFKFNFSEIFPKFVVVFFLFALGVWVGRNVPLNFLPASQVVTNNTKLYSKDGTDFSTFWEVWDDLNSKFLNKKDLSGDKLLHGAISGLVQAAGDPYTSYFDPTANQSFNDQISGSFEGVGIELGADKNNHLVVIAPLDASPAEKAGILAGDVIVTIDSKDATKMTIADAVSAIRGKAGTKVKLAILRGDETAVRNFEITRDTITVKTVNYKIADGVADVTLSQFGDNTDSEWDTAVNAITTQGVTKMVLDLRNDPGGLLTDAIYVASDFLKKGDVVVQQEDANGKKTPFYSDHDGRLQNVKLVIIVNKGSASASEIVTGALMDHKKATVTGAVSFGKGTVQNVIDLKDGSALHVTIAKWLTPNGTWVHGKGITPDVPVTLTTDDTAAGRDPQLDKAKDLLK